MGPPPTGRASVSIELNVGFLGVGEYTVDSLLYCGVGILFCVFTIFGITVEPPLTATSLTVHTFTRFNLSTMATFLCPQGGHCRVRFNCINYQIIGDCKCPQHQKTTTQFSSEH